MKRWASILAAMACCATGAEAQPFGIESRVPNTTLLIDLETQDVPEQLSDIPALLAAGLGQDQTAAGIFPYKPSSELWSDGALKSRFIALPGESQLGYQNDTGWDFPEGAVIVKNFSLPQDFRNPEGSAKRIETRLLIRTANDWEGYSYRWNEEETDATLLTARTPRAFNLIDTDGVAFAYEWTYPSRSDCFRCHNDAANTVLGLNTAQMNHDFAYPTSGVSDNQLRAFEHIGLFSAPLPEAIDDLPRSPDAFDESATVADRAQSYLHANCAICHRPNGPTPVDMDLRWDVPLEERFIVDAVPFGNTLGIENAVRFAPGEPDRSLIPARMASHPFRMPPLATTLIHHEAVALIRQWILLESEVEPVVHSADGDADGVIALDELLRVIQLYNAAGYHCAESPEATEDGFEPGADAGAQSCTPHTSDYSTQDWEIRLSELLRLIQFYNTGGYIACPSSEDGLCANEL